MSIALESNTGNGIKRSEFVHGMTCASICGSRSGISAGDQWYAAGSARRPTTTSVVQEPEEGGLDSCSSSSIGGNSDSSRGTTDGDGDSGEAEVQSSYNGPLGTMDALEEVLPVKRGMSKFYCGKSKSFTSLADASSCSAIKDIAKPENAYTRRRKNLIAHNNFLEKNRSYPFLRSNSGGILKRPANSSRSTLALAVTMSSSGSNINSEKSKSHLSSSILCLPPLYPHGRKSPSNESPASLTQRNLSSWRSLSLSDLQCAAAAPAPSVTGLVLSNRDEDKLC